MKIAFEEFGKGPPVILLHAFPLRGEMWKPQIPALIDENFRVIVPDLRGFGSSKISDPNFELTDMARDVVELLEKLKIEKAVIIGLSMGGYILLNLFGLYPEKFAGLVLADTSSESDTDEKRETRFSLIEKIKNQGAEVLKKELLPNLIGDFTRSENQHLVNYLEKEFAKTDPAGVISALHAMAGRKATTEYLKNIRVPTCLIYGEEDTVTNLETAREMKNRIPSAELQIIKNAGHYSNLEQPARFNKVLLDFLKNAGIEF